MIIGSHFLSHRVDIVTNVAYFEGAIFYYYNRWYWVKVINLYLLLCQYTCIWYST